MGSRRACTAWAGPPMKSASSVLRWRARCYLAPPMSRQLVIASGGTPEFRIFSQTIHMTAYARAELESRADVQLIYFHEYGHMLQAVTTRFGIANFRMVARRYRDLFSAIVFRPELASPHRTWPSEMRADPRAREFLDAEAEFYGAYTLNMGAWSLADSEDRGELQVGELPVRTYSTHVARLHVARRFEGASHWIPLLPKAMCEAHSEALGQILSGTRSQLWGDFGNETRRETLFYTTVPALTYSKLPESLRRPDVVAMLVDHALMFQRPDRAFIAAITWLAASFTDISDLASVRRQLFDQSDEASALEDCRAALAEADALYARADNDVTDMIRYRLAVSRSAVEARASNPAVFLPIGERRKEGVRLHAAVPAPRVEFRDTLCSIGDVPEQVQDHQSMLSSAAHLLKVVAADPNAADPEAREDLDPKCPFKEGPCGHPREPACAMYPWERGEIGGEDEFCHYGRVGGLLWFHFARDRGRLESLVRSTAHTRWSERGEPLWDDLADWFEARRQLGIPDDVHV